MASSCGGWNRLKTSAAWIFFAPTRPARSQQGVVHLDGALDVNGEPSEQVSLYAYLNAHMQTGLPNPLDEAIVKKGGSGGG